MSCDLRKSEVGDRPRTELFAEPKYFALMAELRRSAIYVLVGFALILVIRWQLREIRPLRGVGDLVFGAVTIGVIVLGVVTVLRWQLRVDDRGIARRRLFGWDLWPWEAFEQGRVLEVEDSSTSFICREKPFWARKLSLGGLNEEVQEDLLRTIQSLFVRPPAPSLPADLHIRFAFRKDALIAREGLLVRNRGEETRYAWREVQMLRIRRRYRARNDFSSLEIVLPDQTITLRVSHPNGQTARSWSGMRGSPSPTPAIVAGVLERYVPSDRIQVTALREPPKSLIEWQDRRSLLERQGRDLRILRWIIFGGGGLSFALLTASEFYRDRWSGFKFLILCSISSALFWAVMRYIELDRVESLNSLEAKRPPR
jgi:hypothetical protein